MIFGIDTLDSDKAEIIDIVRQNCHDLGRTDFKLYQAYYSPEDGDIQTHEMDIRYWGFLNSKRRSKVKAQPRGFRSVGNTSVWQLAGYMKEKGVGFFGMLIARNGIVRGVGNHAITDRWVHANKMIVPFSSDDLVTMINSATAAVTPTELVEDMIDRIRCWV